MSSEVGEGGLCQPPSPGSPTRPDDRYLCSSVEQRSEGEAERPPRPLRSAAAADLDEQNLDRSAAIAIEPRWQLDVDPGASGMHPTEKNTRRTKS